MQILDGIQTANDYTAASTIESVYRSNGGFFSVTVADVFFALQYGGQGDLRWTPDIPAPQGTGIIAPDTTGIKFKSYLAGTPATVRAAIALASEPSIVIGAGGQAAALISPGFEYIYLEFNANVVISATTEATANTIITAPGLALDGSTTVWVEFSAPYIDVAANAAGNYVRLVLFDNGVSLGILDLLSGAGAAVFDGPVTVRRRVTPGAGSHAFSIRAFRLNANSTVVGGVGGAGVDMPGYIRVTQA